MEEEIRATYGETEEIQITLQDNTGTRTIKFPNATETDLQTKAEAVIALIMNSETNVLAASGGGQPSKVVIDRVVTERTQIATSDD